MKSSIRNSATSSTSLRGCQASSYGRGKKERLVALRNQLAHANEFAASEESALRACETVRDALELRQSLGRV